MKQSPAVERGIEMMHIPMRDLPDEALVMCKYMCDRYMMCMEVMLTAYVVYAQVVEGLECDDDLYKLTPFVQADWDAAQAKFMVASKTGLPGVVRR